MVRQTVHVTSTPDSVYFLLFNVSKTILHGKLFSFTRSPRIQDRHPAWGRQKGFWQSQWHLNDHTHAKPLKGITDYLLVGNSSPLGVSSEGIHTAVNKLFHRHKQWQAIILLLSCILCITNKPKEYYRKIVDKQ